MKHQLPRQLFSAELHGVAATALPGLRQPLPSDEVALADLMYEAYLGTIDYAGEDRSQALEEVRKTFAGDYGAFHWSASRVMDRDGLIASAALLTRWRDRPFVAFSMTRPEYKRKGLARACLQSAMQQLHSEGEHELRLIVTLANTEALTLYQSVGFQPQGDPR